MEQSHLLFWYVDDSPSHDNIFTELNWTGNRTNIELGGTAEMNGSDRLNFMGSIRIYFPQVFGYDLGIGGNYPIGIGESKNTHLIPQVSVGYGSMSKPIGTIRNNDVYIQVNDIKFDDNKDVEAKLKDYYTFLKPEIILSFKLNEFHDMQISLAYTFASSSPEIGFTGPVNGKSNDEASEEFTDDNVLFLSETNSVNAPYYYNGKYYNHVKESPVNASGLELKLKYTFGRYE
jgi:hypothetical protein